MYLKLDGDNSSNIAYTKTLKLSRPMIYVACFIGCLLGLSLGVVPDY
jgi:hypothetical protein